MTEEKEQELQTSVQAFNEKLKRAQQLRGKISDIEAVLQRAADSVPDGYFRVHGSFGRGGQTAVFPSLSNEEETLLVVEGAKLALERLKKEYEAL